AGTVRTRYGFTVGDFNDEAQKQGLIREVKRIAAQGPLLVELNDAGEIQDWLLPAPADAVLYEADAKLAHVKRLVAEPLSEGITDLPEDLLPVRFASYDEIAKKKPLKQAPRFWRKEMFFDWLANPGDRTIELDRLGHGGPVGESRVHVKIKPDTQAAEEGFLYQTSGLEFTRRSDGKYLRLALAMRTSVEAIAGLAPLGGEQRLSYWRGGDEWLSPACPSGIRRAIKDNKACRVVLLTPAHFREGFRPGLSGWMLQTRHGVAPSLAAAAVGRPQVVSGWDYEIGKPKPTRRLAPAGAVFFLKLDGDERSIDRWIDAVWMNCVSDDDEKGVPEQTRLDGFGLAALGAWSREAGNMEVNK
ncbi:MAG TPA: type III-B CRISPR module-associated protein Cmr3, partial [Blastocatellia bacterium]